MLVPLIAALALVGVAGASLWYLFMQKYKERSMLENYGRRPTSKPLKPFVCPKCLRRNYSATSIETRSCAWCDRDSANIKGL